MVRTQVQFDEDQYAKLKVLARERSQSVSQLVREGVDQILIEAQRSRRWDRLLEAAGRCEDIDGLTDVSQHHDEHLARIYARS